MVNINPPRTNQNSIGVFGVSNLSGCFNKLQKEDIEQKIKDKHWKKKMFKFLTDQEIHQLLFLD